LIRIKARELSRSPGFYRHEEEDLRQELAMHVIQRMRRHDPKRSSLHVYVARVAATKVADLSRHARARKRDRRREQTIDDRVPDRLVQSLRERGWSVERLDMQLDVREALIHLPESQREAANLLMVFRVAEVDRKLGLSRQRARTIREQIERFLIAQGLGRPEPKKTSQRATNPCSSCVYN
jgi:DNA-directed RNA polymerase specialized sigma24 family protein